MPDNNQTALVLSLGSSPLISMRVPRPTQDSATMLATDFIRVGGGKAANVALAALRLGTPAHLFG